MRKKDFRYYIKAAVVFHKIRAMIMIEKPACVTIITILIEILH